MKKFLVLFLMFALLQFGALAQVTTEYVPSEPEEERETKRFKFEIGGAVGLFAAATALNGELRFPLPYIFGPAVTSFRIAGGYAQSVDMGRRYASLQIDGIFNYPPGWFTGVDNYLGAGLNYVVLTSGRTSGSFGGEVFYGVEGTGFGGKLFGEIGYGILRTGFSPSHGGTTLLVGYRREWGF